MTKSKIKACKIHGKVEHELNKVENDKKYYKCKSKLEIKKLISS
jgi:hypothetical protein